MRALGAGWSTVSRPNRRDSSAVNRPPSRDAGARALRPDNSPVASLRDSEKAARMVASGGSAAKVMRGGDGNWASSVASGADLKDKAWRWGRRRRTSWQLLTNEQNAHY